MATLRAQVVLHTTDNTPANYITNSWAFMGTNPFADTTAITAALKGFYDGITASYWSDDLAQNANEINYYDLPGTPPNYPVDQDVWNRASDPSGTPLPQECAICLSFQGARTPGFPQARRRGRVYLGPWGGTANSSGRPTAALLTVIANAATAFKTAINAIASDTQWAVWSTTDQAPVPIVGGWVDNVWDTQRRRGLLETSRTTWT